MAHIIAVSNEKGGSGKTTVAMHVAIALSHRGIAVGTIDLDGCQRSLTRFVENRHLWCEAHSRALPTPQHRLILRSGEDSALAAREEEARDLAAALEELASRCQVIVVDCPAGRHPLSRMAESLAGTLITPLNDSLVDLDLLVQLGPGSHQVRDLGGYLRRILALRKARRRGGHPDFDWILVRNRLSGLADQNKRKLISILDRLAPAVGFRLAEGFGERVIFRQLFAEGLTVLDLGVPGVIPRTKSHEAAEAEIRALVDALRLSGAGG